MAKSPYQVVLLISVTLCSTSFGHSNPGEGFSMTPNIPELRMQQTIAGSMSVIESFKNIGKY